LLALDHAAVAGEQAMLAQVRLGGRVGLDQGARDAEHAGADLAGDATADDVDVDIEAAGGLRDLHRHAEELLQALDTDEVVDGAIVDGDLPAARSDAHARDAGLAATQTP